MNFFFVLKLVLASWNVSMRRNFDDSLSAPFSYFMVGDTKPREAADLIKSHDVFMVKPR